MTLWFRLVRVRARVTLDSRASLSSHLHKPSGRAQIESGRVYRRAGTGAESHNRPACRRPNWTHLRVEALTPNGLQKAAERLLGVRELAMRRYLEDLQLQKVQ